MMLPTHVLAGLALALPVAMLAPAFAVPALLGGAVGGVLPDLDMYAGHRRTLHYPVYLPVLAVPAALLALLVPTALTVGVALAVVSAAVHSVADLFGGGLELRPWRATDDRAVYDHHHGVWLPPLRWVRYDGAPEDLLLSATLAVPVVLLADPWWVEPLVAVALTVAVVYAGVRRLLPVVAALLVRRLPDGVVRHVPERLVPADELREAGLVAD